MVSKYPKTRTVISWEFGSGGLWTDTALEIIMICNCTVCKIGLMSGKICQYGPSYIRYVLSTFFCIIMGSEGDSAAAVLDHDRTPECCNPEWFMSFSSLLFYLFRFRAYFRALLCSLRRVICQPNSLFRGRRSESKVSWARTACQHVSTGWSISSDSRVGLT